MEWTPPHPIDFASSTARFTRWGDDLANRVTDGAFLRVTPNGVAYRASQKGEGSIHVETIAPEDEPDALADLQWRLAESIDRQPLYDLAGRDEIVGGLVAKYPGTRPPLQVDPFQSLITAITAQQVNLTWATTTRSRLIEAYGTPHALFGETVWEFPSADQLARVHPDALRQMQFTTRKSEYIIGVARATVDGALEGLASLSNEAVIERMVALRGIGRWSAEWLLARCLGRPDVIAAGDLAVRKAVSYNYRGSDELLSEELVRDISQPWGNATNLVSHLLLESLNT